MRSKEHVKCVLMMIGAFLGGVILLRGSDAQEPEPADPDLLARYNDVRALVGKAPVTVARVLPREHNVPLEWMAALPLPVQVVADGHPGTVARFDEASGGLIGLRDTEAIRRIMVPSRERVPGWEERIVPVSSPEDVDRVAANVATALTGVNLGTLMKEPARFIKHMRYWSVVWLRTVSGYPFPQEYLWISVADGTLEVVSLDNLLLGGEPDLTVAVTEQQAVERARLWAQRHAQEWSRNYCDGDRWGVGEVQWAMVILYPNGVFDDNEERTRGWRMDPSPEQLARRDVRARLCYWVRVTFRDATPGQPGAPLLPMNLQIDAGTGKVVGLLEGDSRLPPGIAGSED